MKQGTGYQCFIDGAGILVFCQAVNLCNSLVDQEWVIKFVDQEPKDKM